MNKFLDLSLNSKYFENENKEEDQQNKINNQKCFDKKKNKNFILKSELCSTFDSNLNIHKFKSDEISSKPSVLK